MKRIFGIVGVGNDSPTDFPDHRAMPIDQGRESVFAFAAAAGDELLQELPVAHRRRHAKTE